MKNKPRILLVDIETSFMEVMVWQLGQQYVAHDQIKKDWSILSVAAKWLDNDKIMYMDTHNEKDPRNDKKVVKFICDLLDQADYVVSHYGKKFDIPKIETRREFHKIPLISLPKHEDTKMMASGKYSFSSNKLEYICKYLGVKYKKMTTERKFQGRALWTECLNKNPEAWKEMKQYNCRDILALEGVYERLRPRGSTINPQLYSNDSEMICVCGSKEFTRNGYAFTASGKFTRYKCKKCNRESRSKVNLLTPEQRKSLLVKT